MNLEPLAKGLTIKQRAGLNRKRLSIRPQGQSARRANYSAFLHSEITWFYPISVISSSALRLGMAHLPPRTVYNHVGALRRYQVLAKNIRFGGVTNPNFANNYVKLVCLKKIMSRLWYIEPISFVKTQKKLTILSVVKHKH